MKKTTKKTAKKLKIPRLELGDALLIVDPQYDFMPGGALAIVEGDKIVSVANQWIAAANQAGIPVIISRDWHPPHHISFKEQGGRWPVHCVQKTKGARFHPSLKIPKHALIVNKAMDANKEAYSALEGFTDKQSIPLPQKLSELKVTRLWIGGLAFDFCVHYSALQARKLGFRTRVILSACRSISDESQQKSFKEMANAGVEFETDENPYRK